MTTSTITMDQFFSKCGELLDTGIDIQGTFPQRTFTSCFFYQNGSARFNGRSWEFVLY